MSSQVTNICLACHQKNDPGMTYCIYCGNLLRKEDVCSSCGKASKFNSQFCIFCGAGRDSVLVASPPALSTAGSQENSRFHRRTQPRYNFRYIFSVVAGLLCGIIIAFFSCEFLLKPKLLEQSWPKQGIVIYAWPPLADVLINDVNEKTFVVAATSSIGTLALDSLSPGEYLISLAATKHKRLNLEAKVVINHPSVFGFPEPLKLEPQ